MTDLLDPEVRKRAAKREGIILFSILAGLILAAIVAILATGDTIEVKYYDDPAAVAEEYDEGVIIACTFDEAPPFIITDQNRQKCEGGTITVWEKAKTIYIGEPKE